MWRKPSSRAPKSHGFPLHVCDLVAEVAANGSEILNVADSLRLKVYALSLILSLLLMALPQDSILLILTLLLKALE